MFVLEGIRFTSEWIPIFTWLVNTCWYCFRGVVALAIVALLVVGCYLYLRLDDETRRLAELALSRNCEPFVAKVGSASFAPGKGVVMHDVQLLEPLANGTTETVLQIDELRLEGRFDIASLMRAAPEVNRVVVRKPKMLVARRPDGSWNYQSLRMPRPSGSNPPSVEIQNATLVLRDKFNQRNQQYKLQELNATINPSPTGEPSSYDFLVGSKNFIAKEIKLAGKINLATGSFEANTQVLQALLSQDLLTSLPLPIALANKLASIRPLPAMRIATSFNATARRGGFNQPVDWAAKFQITDGEIHLAQLQRPLTSLRVVGECDNNQLRINQSHALWGDATLNAALHRKGWHSNAPLATRCQLTNCDVTHMPIAAAPVEAQNLWQRFRPTGIADLALDATFDGKQWNPKATLKLRDGSFEDAEKFPYRLTGGSGVINLFGGVPHGADVGNQSFATAETAPPVAIDLTAFVEATPIRIVAKFNELLPTGPRLPNGKRPMPPGSIEISGMGIPITQRLVSALPDAKTQATIESLRPSGRVDVLWRIERPSPIEPDLTTSLDLRLAGCQVNYTKFPYPLSNVTGWVRQRNRIWTFSELESRDTQGNILVSGSGNLAPSGAGHRFALQLQGNHVPLDERLYAGMPVATQGVWDFLRPRGQINFSTTITTEPGAREPQVQLSMTPHERTVSIEPPLSGNGYRYRLERLDGQFDWNNNLLTIRGARADHGRTSYATDGTWRLNPGVSWQLDLNRLYADRLAFNHDLLLSSPPGLRSVLETIQPQGGFDLANSKLRIVQPLGSGSVAQASWDISLACHQPSLLAGLPIEGDSGNVRQIGSSDGVSAHTGGELDLDSVVWNDLQLTRVRGPIWADDNQCLLGEGASRKLGGKPRKLEAIAYNGGVKINSQVLHGGRPRYGLSIQMDKIDVARMAAEWLQRPEAIEGLMEGRLEFEGTGTSIYGLTGKGELVVTEANLYELPVLVRLLKVLRNRTPDNTAFDRCETKFAMRGEQIHFEDLDLLGDAVSLYGQGEATLDRELNLTFHTLVGRTDKSAMFRTLMGQASEQLLQLRVVGTCDQPEIRREVLPGVGNMLGQLQNNGLGASPGTQPNEPRSSYTGSLRNQVQTQPTTR